VIRGELKRRGIPEPPISTQNALQQNPNLMGDLVEKVSLHKTAPNDWIGWLLGVPLLLGLGVLLLRSSAQSPRDLLIGGIIIGGVVWSIVKAIEERQSHLLFYKRGLVYQRPDHRDVG
jgi:hypothetical protein